MAIEDRVTVLEGQIEALKDRIDGDDDLEGEFASVKIRIRRLRINLNRIEDMLEGEPNHDAITWDTPLIDQEVSIGL